MQEPEQKTFQRQIAFKTRISYILSSDGENTARVNVIATVVYKPEKDNNSLMIDDGTGKILLRTFEASDIFSKADVGDAVIVIGKVREYGSEKYIMPEIIKKLDNFEWMNVRKLELKDMVVPAKAARNAEQSAETDESAGSVSEEIYLLIKKFDSGDGAPTDDIIKNSKAADAEKIINTLLENGDIFEIKPGRLKILE